MIGRGTGAGVVAALLATLFAVVAACTPSVVVSPFSPQPSASATSVPPSPTADTPTPGPAIGTTVKIDPSLLEILPAAVEGVPIIENPEGEAAALADPMLPAVGSAIAAGLAIEPASGEFVFAVVVRLLPGAMDAAAFRDWRDSYDTGACSQAGGVVGHAETELGGRTVYIGTCAGGVRTYHVWLEPDGVLVSASAVGERRLGERLVEGLRP